jgi:hypothetical protein
MDSRLSRDAREDFVVDEGCGNLPKQSLKIREVAQFEGGDSYQGTPSGVPQKPPRMPATLVPIAFPRPKHTKDAQNGGPAANAAGPFSCEALIANGKGTTSSRTA